MHILLPPHVAYHVFFLSSFFLGGGGVKMLENQSRPLWNTAKMASGRVKVHELFPRRAQTATDGWLTDETQRHIWKTERQRPQTGTHPLLLCLLSTSPLQPHPFSQAPLLLSLHMSMNLSLWQPHPKGRRGGCGGGLLSLRQISMAGLIYDGLFRDYNTLMRGQNVSSRMHK